MASFYEAAALPELWSKALQGLADLVGSRGALLTQANRDHDGLVCSASLRPTVAQFFEQGWNTRDFRTEALLSRPGGLGQQETLATFRADQDIIAADHLKSSPYYQDFARPAGVPWFCATGMRLMNGVIVGLSLQRSASQGPFSHSELAQLNGLLPQLQRALGLAGRVAYQEAGSMAAALDCTGEAAILLNHSGQIVGLNDAAEAMIGTVLQRQGAALAAVAPACRAAFAKFIEAGCGGASHLGARLPPMRLTRADDTPVLAHLVPIAGQAQDVFGAARTLLLLSPVGPGKAIQTDVLRIAFDLTPGELRVARLLATGVATKRIAAALDITENAVRFHIKAILSKNGFRRQAEFVAAAAPMIQPT